MREKSKTLYLVLKHEASKKGHLHYCYSRLNDLATDSKCTMFSLQPNVFCL